MNTFHFFENDRVPKSYKKSAYEFVTHKHPELLSHFFFPSSGSAGRLKWLLLSAEALSASAQSINNFLEVKKSDLWCKPLPSFHVGGYSIFLRAKLSGLAVHEYLDKWNAQAFVNFLSLNGATLTSLVPTQIVDFVNQSLLAPKCLRAAFVGGGALSSGLYIKARELGWPILPTYGMTEAASQIATARLNSLSSNEFPKLYLLPHWEVKLSEGGKLMLRGPALASAVLELVGDAWILNLFDKSKYFETADYVKLEKTAFGTSLEFLGRVEGEFKVSGELCSLDKIQSQLDKVLLELSYGQNIVVLNLPDPRTDQSIVLVGEYEVKEDTLQQILKKLREHLTSIEVPTRFLLVDKLPRSALGKIDRNLLRKILA